MIDDGAAFQGSDWTFRESAVQGLYARAAAYGDCPALPSFDPWLQRLMAMDQTVLEQAHSFIPSAWLAGDEAAFEKMLLRLWPRRERVVDLVRESIRSLTNS
jgi:hypothetical protein